MESFIFLLNNSKVLVDSSFQELSTSNNLDIGLICIPILLNYSIVILNGIMTYEDFDFLTLTIVTFLDRKGID